MKESQFIKQLRSRFTTFIAGSVVQQSEIDQKVEMAPEDVKRILVSRPNHRLGNQLLMTPLVKELETVFPNAKIDLFVKGGASFPIFQNYSSIGKIIPLPKDHFKKIFNYLGVWAKLKTKTYDLVVNADKDSSSGNLCVKLAKAKYKVYGDPEIDMATEPLEKQHIAKYPVYDFRNALDVAVYGKQEQPIPKLDIKLDEQEKEKGAELLKALVKNNKPSICVFTNATGDKLYPSDWWMPLYKRLKSEFPDFNIVELLPIENTSQINFMAPNLYSKDLREMGGFISACSLFIAPDNGTMHLAASTDTPVIGFFKSNSINKYRPYGNLNTAFNTNESSIDDWISAAKAILKSGE